MSTQGGPQKNRDVPIWARPEPGTRRPRHSREQIAAAALAVADAEGIDAVSMRRVAAELGAGTMTLYHYVDTKDDLLALMDDAIMGELLIPTEELPVDWRPALAAIARRTREVWRRHPWAINMHSGEGGPNGMRHFEQSLAAARSLDPDPAFRLEIIAMLDDYVFGFALREGEFEEGRAQADEQTWERVSAYIDEQLRTGEFPELEALAAGREQREM